MLSSELLPGFLRSVHPNDLKLGFMTDRKSSADCLPLFNEYDTLSFFLHNYPKTETDICITHFIKDIRHSRHQHV